MLPINSGGHTAYQDTFVSSFLKFYPNPFVLTKSTWNHVVQFWYLDPSQTDSIMRDYCSVFGSAPRHPSCMLRSYLLVYSSLIPFHYTTNCYNWEYLLRLLFKMFK